MNIIWTKEELKKISYFLRKSNLRLEDNNNIIVLNRNKNYFSDIVNDKGDEIKRLFYLQDREEILNVLKSTTKIKELVEQNLNNPFYFGFLSALAKTNINDVTEIFNIFKEIVSQYYKVSFSAVTNLTNNLPKEDYVRIIQEKIEEIKNSDTETLEEKDIKNYMNLIFSYAKDITDSSIFRPIIENCNNNIRNRLIEDLNQKISGFRQKINKTTEIDIKSYNNEKYYKLYAKKRKAEKDGYNMDKR